MGSGGDAMGSRLSGGVRRSQRPTVALCSLPSQGYWAGLESKDPSLKPLSPPSHGDYEMRQQPWTFSSISSMGALNFKSGGSPLVTV